MAIKAVAFDLDGTIYFGNQPAEGALETVNFLKTQGLSIFYFTNNSSATRSNLLEKLISMGFDLGIDDIYSSAFATAKYLKDKNITNVYCIGSQGLIHELEELNIRIVAPDFAETMVIGLDIDITYAKISAALNFVTQNETVVVCNKDRNYLIENNELRPGCGSLVAAIEYAAGKTFGCIIGKPSPYMMELLLKENGLSREEVLVVGDTYESDIAMAKNIGCPSVFISASDSYSDTKVIRNIAEIRSDWDILNS